MVEAWSSDSQSLLDRPSPTVLATYRKDGSASVSPVWFRFHEQDLEMVIAEGDAKPGHLERVPRCSLTVSETEPPFRGLTIEGAPRLEPDEGDKARLVIASRYLGRELGRRFVEQRRTPGLVLRTDPTEVREWDLSGILPQG